MLPREEQMQRNREAAQRWRKSRKVKDDRTPKDKGRGRTT